MPPKLIHSLPHEALVTYISLVGYFRIQEDDFRSVSMAERLHFGKKEMQSIVLCCQVKQITCIIMGQRNVYNL